MTPNTINISRKDAINKIVSEFKLTDGSKGHKDGESFYINGEDDTADFFFDKRKHTRQEVIEKLVGMFGQVNIVDGQCSIDPITLLWTTAKIEKRNI